MFRRELPSMPYMADFESAFARTTWHNERFSMLAGTAAALICRYVCVASRAPPVAPSRVRSGSVSAKDATATATLNAKVAQNANELRLRAPFALWLPSLRDMAVAAPTPNRSAKAMTTARNGMHREGAARADVSPKRPMNRVSVKL